MVRLRLSIFVFIISLLWNCSPQTKENSAEKTAETSKKANAYFDKIFNEGVDRSPMYQTHLGIKKDYDKWDDISEEAELKEIEIAKQHLAYLNDSIDINQLDKQTQLSYKLMKQSLKDEIVDYQYRHNTYPINQMFGWQSQIPAFLIGFHSVSNKEEAEDYIKRLKGITQLMSQINTKLKANEKKGVMLPKFLYPTVIGASKNVISGKPLDKSSSPNALYNDISTKINKIETLSEEDKKNLIGEAEKALKENVKPAYESLIEILETQEKVANNDAGVWRFQDGDTYYKQALAKTTTTDLTAEQIHEIGLKEVERIHGEMKKIMVQVEFKGDLQAFFKFTKEDAQFYYPDTDEGKQAYLDSATRLVDNMKAKLDEIFITKPKADMVVKRVEAFREKSAGKAFYNEPAIDGTRPGYYYANLYDMKQMPKYEMEALAFHEGIPGHHMQLAIAQELQGLPEFRKYSHYTAYIEGWALYCELIPKEIGFYTDPYSDFGRLAMELWRACRLVVDTGIHAKKWTREQSIKFYTDNTPSAYGACEKMVDRHIVMPSQATAYKIGMLKIIELREKAQNTLGDKFDIRGFHDTLLTNGAVPLNVLEELVDQWIESKK